MSVASLRHFSIVAFAIVLTACGTLVAPYDDTYDQSLNKFSEDTAKFVAAASAGGNEKSYSSKEATAFYASAYDLLDRLDARARLTRASIPCPGAIQALRVVIKDASTLPAEYEKFDCREVELYIVRVYVTKLEADHKTNNLLTKTEATISGGLLRQGIILAIQTFLVNKPTK